MSDASGVVGSAATELRKNFLVVGLGGSAGAIPAFREFFRNVPSDSGMAFVVILHLSPEHESRLAEVLQGSSAIPVTQVRERVKVEPDHVYVIPPNHSLTMIDGTLLLSQMVGFEERRAPVDIFFRTLGEAHDSHAACVILSGSGSDGSMGLRRVKEHNGLVLVQDPNEAQFEEMPRHSIATGLVDMVLPVGQMPARIIAYRDQIREAPIHSDEPDGDDEQALAGIFTNLRARTGHDFSNYKRGTVLRRIERRMALHGLTRLSQYAQLIRERSDEADRLLRELLISVTNFFRDPRVWERVERTVIPKLLEGKGRDDHVRAWVAGCATGEEAYSVAMLLAEAAAEMPSPPDIQIFATDLDAEAIAKARNGVYNDADVADVPPERLRLHFVREQEHYRVRRELREMILFAHHNLIKDPPFSHIDFVSCRNLLIYLNRAAQDRTMEVLHFALEPGGWLLLGTAESADGSSQLFSTADKESHLYQSRAVPRVINVPAPARQLTISSDLRATEPPRDRGEPGALPFTPPDPDHRLVEETQPAAGEPAPRQLEDELLRARAQMLVTVEQYEVQAEDARAANEELQAMIEELRSTAEELETSQEELQSLNEELQTVNQELKVKIEEVGHTNDDLRNLMSSTEIGTIFVDRLLRVKLFTPRVRDIFNLIPADVGRPLLDINSKLTTDTLAGDLDAVLDRLQILEREVESRDGRWYLMRLLPYRTAEDRIDGVVLTFLEVTERHRAQEVLRDTQQRQTYLLELSDALRELSDPAEIQTTGSRVLGLHLGSGRAYCVEIDEAAGEYVVAGDWHQPGETSHAGRYPIASWPMPWLAKGETWTLTDVDTDPALPDDRRDVYRENGVGSAVVVPITKRGQVVATFVTNQRRPRAWTAHEIGIVEETAERTWVAVERARVEAALRQSEALLAVELEDAKALQKISSQLMHEQDSGVLYEEIVDAAMALMRSDAGSLQMLDDEGATLRLLAWKGFHPDSARYWETVTSATESACGGALATGLREIIPDILTLQRLKGSASLAEYLRSGIRSIQSTPLLSRDGRTVGMISTHWREPHVPGERELRLFDVLARQAADVLGSRRIEEALRESEERYRTLFASIDEGFCIIDVLFDANGKPYDYRFLEVNPAFEKQTGLNHAVGRTMREMVPAHEAHWFETYGRIARTAVPARFENEAKGLGRIYEVYAFPFGGPRRRVAVLFNDITSRKNAAAAVRDSEQRLQTVTNLVPDLLWSNDAAGVMDWCNGRWLEYTGQTFKEGCSRGWLGLIHPEDDDASRRRFQSAIQSGEPLRMEHRMRNAAGDYRWFLVQAEPLRDADGRIVRWFGAATDIHEQRVAREDLEQRVQERSRELAALSVQRQQLLERLVVTTEEERQRIARELHDEMGQHLTALRVAVQTLQPPDARFEHMKNVIDHLDQSVDRMTFELRPPALDHLGLHGAIASLSEEFSANSGVRVDVHLSGVEGERFADPIETAIYRVVQEALTNVSRHAAAKTVSVIVDRDADTLRMIVEDDGRGFDGDGALESETARGRFGLLGMRERLALIGGSFHIESQPGSGTAIYVRVPLTRSPVA